MHLQGSLPATRGSVVYNYHLEAIVSQQLDVMSEVLIRGYDHEGGM